MINFLWNAAQHISAMLKIIWQPKRQNNLLNRSLIARNAFHTLIVRISFFCVLARCSKQHKRWISFKSSNLTFTCRRHIKVRNFFSLFTLTASAECGKKYKATHFLMLWQFTIFCMCAIQDIRPSWTLMSVEWEFCECQH